MDRINNRGIAVYILEDNKHIESRIYVVRNTPGSESDQYPHRLKLGGISMMLVIIKCIIHCHKIKNSLIHLVLDEKKATEQARGNLSLYPT